MYIRLVKVYFFRTNNIFNKSELLKKYSFSRRNQKLIPDFKKRTWCVYQDIFGLSIFMVLDNTKMMELTVLLQDVIVFNGILCYTEGDENLRNSI